MAKHRVLVTVSVPAHAYIEVNAKDHSAAERKVTRDIEKRGWDSDVWQNCEFEPEWAEAENLQVAETAPI